MLGHYDRDLNNAMEAQIASTLPSCDGEKDCIAPITHICSKGWVYCERHAQRGDRPARKLRQWEVRWLEDGKPLPSYKPGRKPVTAR